MSFSADTHSWLEKFKARFSLKLRTISGESGGYNMNLINSSRTHLKEYLSSYMLRCIYDLDETALLHCWKKNCHPLKIKKTGQ